jgi:DNA-binding response OmpR family regulator
MKLLLVEDDELTVEALKMCLQMYEPTLKLEVAGEGQEAISKIMQDNYAGVILDLGLPDIDGTEVIGQLRTFSKMPVIVVSARRNPEDISKALSLGANDYVVKPFDYWNLLNHMDNLFKIKDQN